MMKAKKLSRVILSLALSAALLAEPAASIPVVYAEETQVLDWTEVDQSSDDIENDNQGKTDQSEMEDSEGDTGSGTGENSGLKDESVEEGNGKGDQSESENDGKDDENGSEENDEEDNEDDSDNEDEEQIEDEETDDSEEAEELEEAENLEDLEAEETEDDLNGFSEMPAEYKLTSSQKSLKSELAGFLSQVDERDEGNTYAERRVVTFADGWETAEKIAEAYHAEIISFDMGVLTLRLSKDKTVKAALTVAADLDNNLPAVWPDYKRELYGEVPLEISEDDASELEIVEEEYTLDDVYVIEESDDDEIPSLEEYEQVLTELSRFSDPYLSPTSDDYQWFHTTIGSPYAWDAGYMGQGIRVGVVDSGVDKNGDLESNVSDRRDFCDNTSAAADTLGHGTHVAGIIAAKADGSAGVGVAPNAQIYNAKVFGENEEKSGYDSTIIAAINYLIGEEDNSSSIEICDEPARVDIINMSLGGPGKNPLFQLVLDKAYQKGVVVFAATGNDGGSLMQYPASYNHVIAVAATDTNNQRAYFSNYGTSTDLAAPGVNIWSTYGSGSGYKSLQGTSMACPVAAGEAAVILSGEMNLAALAGKMGKARVDAVESIMKSNTISAGSGMGKGITSLPKVFKLSTAAAKPNAPVITPNVAEDKQSVEITIQVQSGMSLCYTTNGKNPVYKNGEPDVNTTYVDSITLEDQQNVVTLSFDYMQSAKGTVKAFAINASGVIGPVKSLSYTLQPYVREITISGPTKVEQGKSVQLTATVAPSYATNKKVKWEILDSIERPITDNTIKISAQGKITTTANAAEGYYYAIATAEDAGGVSSEPIEIRVVATYEVIQSLAFNKATNKELWIIAPDQEPSRELVNNLVAKRTDPDGVLEEISGDGGSLNGDVVWTSSKPAVAEVDYYTGAVTAKSAGTTTITAKANDNRNKKATIKITVKQAVMTMEITTDKGRTDQEAFVIAAGKSMTLKAVLNQGMSKPTNSKIVWSISPAGNETENKDVTINASTGKITAKAGVSGSYVVTATAADKQGAEVTQVIQVYGGAIGGIKLDKTKQTLYTKFVDSTKTNTATIHAMISGEKNNTDFNPNAYTVTSSNESIVKVSSSNSSDGGVDITVTATGNMYGKANVVITSTDGSNKKATCAVTVSGGITKVEMQDVNKKKVSKLTMFRQGTAATKHKTEELQAVIGGSDGANLTAYDVTSSNPNLVKATLDKNTGKIKLETGANLTGKATITLMATDGSKKKATCTVTVCNPPSGINIAPKAGEKGCVVPGKSVQLVATMETEDGVISNKNVIWSLDEEEAQILANYGVTINASSGKITVPKTYHGYSVNNLLLLNQKTEVNVKVYAEAKDGSGVVGKGHFSLAPATTTIYVSDPNLVNGVLYIYFQSDCFTDVTCSSSAPKVASPTIEYTPAHCVEVAGESGESQIKLVPGEGCIKFVPNQKGTVSFTLKAMDGSGKQVKTVTIRFK